MGKIDNEIAVEEKRVRAKISRLKNKGVNTGNINPIKNTENMTAKQKQSYVYKMRNFMDTGYIATEGGSPIKRSLVQQIRANERAINKERAEKFGYAGLDPKEIKTFMGARKLDELQEIQRKNRGRISAAPIPPRNIKAMNSEKAVQQYLSTLHRMQDPVYIADKIQILRDNMEERAKMIQSPELEAILPTLTDSEIEELYAKSDFIEVIFWGTNDKLAASDLAEVPQQIIQFEGQAETLLDYITTMRASKLMA